MLMALSKGLAVSGAPSRADFGSLSLTSSTVVAITSVVTETVHPTMIVTEVTTTVGSSQMETSLSTTGQPQGDKSSGLTVHSGTAQTIASQTSQSQTVQMVISTTSLLTILVPESTATATTPAPWSADDSGSFSAAAEHSSVSLPSVVGHSNADAQTSSSELVTVSSWSSTTLVESSTASSPPTSATTSTVLGVTITIPTPASTQRSSSTLVTSGLTPIISTSVTSQSSISSPSPSPSSSSVGGIISGSDSSAGQTSKSQYNSHVGAIVGGTVGGAVFVALVLLACTLCLRRRRQKTPIKPQGSAGRGLLRNSSDSLTTFRGPHSWHVQQDSQPSHPMGPMFSPRGNTMSSAPAPNPALAAFNQGPPFKTMFAQQESQHPISDPEHSPVSPIINVHPPSRTASTYSQPSCEGSLGYLEKYDYESPTRNSRYESIYYPDENVVTPLIPEDDKLAPRESRKTRLSTRSDPFDLEVPPKVLHEWPLPPRPTPWGDNF